MTTFAEGLICDRWPVLMPDFRVEFHSAREKWEVGRLEHMAERIQPGMVVYDIGAELGDFTSLYASWGATVVPVEPQPKMWPCIRQTWEANGFAPPPAWFHGFAADRRWRMADGFGLAGWPVASEGEAVADPGFLHLAPHGRQLPCATVDALAGNGPVPDALTIDVEGAEHHVLAGAQTLLRHRPVLVWVSVHEATMRNWYDRGLDDIHSLMHECGYAGELLPHHGEGESFWFYERRSA